MSSVVAGLVVTRFVVAGLIVPPENDTVETIVSKVN